MNQPAPISIDTTVLAVVHCTGRVWRGLMVSTRAAKPALIATRDFPTDRFSQSPQFDEWLDEHHAGSVLCVLPAGSVICRNSPLPDAPPDQLDQALRLQAEAHLLGVASPHRLAMAVLPQAPGETSRTGLILAWPESAAFEPPPTTRQVRYVPDVACLAAILNGQRPAEPLLWLDRGNGTVALALSHAGGAMFRGTAEDSQSAELWQRNVGRIVAETALSVGHTGAFVESMAQEARRTAATLGPSDAALFANQALIGAAAARIQDISSEPKWWSQYGVAAGAILARTGQLSALTQLLRTPPVEIPSRLKLVAESLSRPKAAIVAVLACAAVLMLGPLAVSAVRLGILKLRYSDIDARLVAARDSEHQLALYDELQKQKAWPMTKLLADLTTNTPMGIDLERISIESGKDFSVNGTVNASEGTGKKLSPQEVFALMQENLGKDGIFHEIVPHWGGANNFGTYKFDLTGKVRSPYKQARYEMDRDFGPWTYAMRRDGDPPPGKSPAKPSGPSGTSEPSTALVDAGSGRNPGKASEMGPPGRNSVAVESASDPDPSADDSSNLPEGATADAGGSGRTRRTRSMTAEFDPALGGGDVSPFGEVDDAGVDHKRDVPAPLTSDQITAMKLPELQQALQRVANARRYYKDTTEETGARLKKEMDMLIAQIRKAKETT